MKSALVLLAASALWALAGTATAAPADDIVAKEKCSKCHTATTTKKGPSWASVADKYKGNTEAHAKLFTYLKTGGKMSDGDEHKKMPGSDADLKAVVNLVLTAK